LFAQCAHFEITRKIGLYWLDTQLTQSNCFNQRAEHQPRLASRSLQLGVVGKLLELVTPKYLLAQIGGHVHPLTRGADAERSELGCDPLPTFKLAAIEPREDGGVFSLLRSGRLGVIAAQILEDAGLETAFDDARGDRFGQGRGFGRRASGTEPEARRRDQTGAEPPRLYPSNASLGFLAAAVSSSRRRGA
jgi:hypothetical protein